MITNPDWSERWTAAKAEEELEGFSKARDFITKKVIPSW